MTIERRKSGTAQVTTKEEFLARYAAGMHKLLDIAISVDNPVLGSGVAEILPGCIRTHLQVKASGIAASAEKMTALADEFDRLVEDTHQRVALADKFRDAGDEQ
jgi:hypothetical protein